MGRKHGALVDRLVAFSGNPLVLFEALERARSADGGPPTLPDLLAEILAVRERQGMGRPVL